MTADYQVMPPLADEDFAALKADIEARGVLVPVEYDEDGNILDGHHRVQACEELGITDWPRFIRKGLSEDEKRAHAMTLNLARRHLSKDQRASLWADMRAAGMSYRQIAEADGSVSKNTVQRELSAVPNGTPAEEPATITGKDGKEYPARKPVRTAYVDPTPEGKQETLAVAKDIRSQLNTERKAERAERAKTLAEQVSDLPGGKRYRVIYADPPWSYGDKRDDAASKSYTGAQHHYPSMSIAELCDLPVKALAQDDAVLFLWVTSPLLYEAAPIFDAWGFKYKSSFIWDKVGHNVGHYNSVRHEFLLIGTRGSCTPDVPTLHDSVVEIPKSRKHSEKPEEFRQLIDSMYPHGLRLELFRRGAAPDGWDVWGNEADARNAS